MDHWIPASRHISVHDSEGQLISWLSQDWVDGWVTSSNGTQTFMPDGSIRREYRSYSNGSTPITYVAIEAYDAADRWTLHETQTWWDDVLGYNDRLTRSFNASGREQEIVHSFGQGGEWYWIDRDSAAYDERNRLTTIGHSSWNEPGWMPFSDMSVLQEYSWETADEAGNAYQFEDYQTIRFAYRDAATSVEPIVATLPATTELTQNYPNPFNPSTTIRFSVAQPAPTTLRIYDLLGREVAQLVNERKEPGNYEVRFDASGLASGMYISQFTSGTVTQTKKMILMR
jgi:hypothetical protein